MGRARSVAAIVLALAVLAMSSGPVIAQTDDVEERLAALEERVVSLEATVAAMSESEPETISTPIVNSESDSVAPVSRSSGGDGSAPTSPIAFGEAATVGSYQIRVIAVDNNAEAAILTENQFNDPAQPGKTMVMVTLEATYQGSKVGTVWIDLNMKALGSLGLAYPDSGETRCGSIPSSSMDVPDMYPGATTTFNVCWQVPTEEVDSLVMVAEELFSFDDAAVFFDLRN